MIITIFLVKNLTRYLDYKIEKLSCTVVNSEGSGKDLSLNSDSTTHKWNVFGPVS